MFIVVYTVVEKGGNLALHVSSKRGIWEHMKACVDSNLEVFKSF